MTDRQAIAAQMLAILYPVVEKINERMVVDAFSIADMILAEPPSQSVSIVETPAQSGLTPRTVDVPDAPGLWLCFVNGQFYAFYRIILSPEAGIAIARSTGITSVLKQPNTRWYGPIPENGEVSK